MKQLIEPKPYMSLEVGELDLMVEMFPNLIAPCFAI